MRVSYSRRANADLDVIFRYIAAEDRAAAERTVARILQAVAMLELFPDLGRPGRVNGTRELPIVRLRYHAVYRSNNSMIEVIALLHERRRYPPSR